MAGDPEAPFLPPPAFDGFVVERPLGRGGMGHVYLGRDEDLDRSVALKFVIPREGTENAFERFRREARAIARLSHQNVVSIYRIGEVNGHPYIAYELVSGKSLDRTAMPLPWQVVLRIAVGMARGLEAVHRAGILHRDLKPANVVLSDAGEIKLIDFGLASFGGDEPVVSAPTSRSEVPTSALARSLENLRLTHPGSVLGTASYIAPETWCGEGTSTRSDVWALGMTLYEMLVGRLPHADFPLEELTRFILLHELPSLRERRPDAPESFVQVIERCLRKDPLERFASGAELREVLDTTERIFLPAGGSTLDTLVLEPNHVAVASSFTRVKNDGSFARTIYDRLFARAPELRALFPADMNGQEKKLIHMIEIAIDAISGESSASLDAMLADLGRRHVHYGARVEHFAPLWAAVLDALEHHDRAAWNTEVAAAWRHALALLEERMRRGMGSERPTFVSSTQNILRASPPMFGRRPSVEPPSPDVPRTQYAHHGAVDIAYQRFGDGPVDVVVLMGWLSHVELNWAHGSLMAFLEQLGRFARVVTYDRRGTGLSVRAPEAATLDDHVDDLLLECSEANLVRPVLFGIGDGGAIAAVGAALHPDRFSGLVLYGATPRLAASPDFPIGATTETLASVEREIRARWGEPILLDVHAPSMVDDREFRDWFALYMRMSASPRNALALWSAHAQRDLRPILPYANLPALVLHRDGDRLVPAASGRYVAERLPRATFAALEGEDHLPWVGDTAELLRQMRAFVSRLRPTTSTAPPPLRLVASFRGAPSLDRAAEALAAPLGGTALATVNGVRHFAFKKGREAVVFLIGLAEAAQNLHADLTCALDVATDDGDVAARADALLARGSGGHAAVSEAAAALVAGANAAVRWIDGAGAIALVSPTAA